MKNFFTSMLGALVALFIFTGGCAVLFLGFVAVLPSLFIAHGGFSQGTSQALGGTSVLIVVGVALDTMRQMESQMMMRSYEGFLR